MSEKNSESDGPADQDSTRILFLCTGNSCRSHMAEGLLRFLAGDRFESLSAGSKPSGYVHPLAIEVMAEVDIDISGHRSKSIDEYLPPHGLPPDIVISVCDNAANECPTIPEKVERLHIAFEDPASAPGTVEEKLAVFRRVRDEIRETLQQALGLES